jgi:hypothetical protein
MRPLSRATSCRSIFDSCPNPVHCRASEGKRSPERHGAPARSLILGDRASPRRAQKVAQQSVALLVAALVNVVDQAHRERGRAHRIKAVRFHRLRRSNPAGVSPLLRRAGRTPRAWPSRGPSVGSRLDRGTWHLIGWCVRTWSFNSGTRERSERFAPARPRDEISDVAVTRPAAFLSRALPAAPLTGPWRPARGSDQREARRQPGEPFDAAARTSLRTPTLSPQT